MQGFTSLVLVQALTQGNFTLEFVYTGGSDNYPYATNLAEPDQITSATEAVNAPNETFVSFTYPASLEPALQDFFDTNSSYLYSQNITAWTLTDAPCDASPTGFCAPGKLFEV